MTKPYVILNFYFFTSHNFNSVGIATDYGLDGSGIEPREGEIFHHSRPGLGPTQLTVQWVPALSRG